MAMPVWNELSDLVVAVVSEDIANIQRCFERRIDVNWTNGRGVSALHVAAFIGNASIAAVLLERGASAEIGDGQGLTPLHWASASNNTEVVQLLLPKVSLDRRNHLQQTALHLAACEGALEAVRIITNHTKALNDLEDFNGCTALHIACTNGHTEVAKCLIEAGADFNKRSKDGRSVMHFAASFNCTHVMEYLLSKGVDPFAVDLNGRSALHYAAKSGYASSDVMKLLMKANASLVATDKYGFTALHYAAQCGELKTTIWLAKVHCSINSDGLTLGARDGMTPLHIAAHRTESGSLLALFIQMVDPDSLNLPTSTGLTPLHMASEWNRINRVAALLKAGASPSAAFESGRLATPLHCAALAGHLSVAKHLIDADANVNAVMSGGETPLHLAACGSSQHLQLAELFLDSGAVVDAVCEKGRTPLMVASNSDAVHCERIVELLLEKGADVTLKDSYGWTALHFAAAKGNHMVVPLLLQNGADALVLDNNGRMPMHYAAQHPQGRNAVLSLYEMDKERVATSTDDCQGFLPLHLAAFSGNADVVQLMMTRMQLKELPLSRGGASLSPLHLAAIQNHIHVIARITKFFLDQGTPAKKTRTITDGYNRMPVYYAMKYGNINSVKMLLETEELDVPLVCNWADKDDVTPLLAAAANGHVRCLNYILSRFTTVGVNRLDSFQRTSGMLSITNCREMCKLLLEKSCLGRYDINGRGYLHRAVHANNLQLVVELLKSSLIDVNHSDVNGVTPLHLANSVEMVRLLLSTKADPTKRDKYGMTPADWAAACGMDSNLLVLLSPEKVAATNGPKTLRVVTGRGLLLAARGNHFDCFTHIIEYDRSLIRFVDASGRGCLHMAAAKGNYQVVDHLLNMMSPLDVTDCYGQTPLMMSLRDERAFHTAELLFDKCAMTSPFSIGAVDKDGNNVLHLALIHRNEDMAKTIIATLVQTDPDRYIFNAANKLGQTPLHIVVKSGLCDLMFDLIPYTKPSFRLKDAMGRIPLFGMIEDLDVLENMTVLINFMDVGAEPLLDTERTSRRSGSRLVNGSCEPVDTEPVSRKSTMDSTTSESY